MTILFFLFDDLRVFSLYKSCLVEVLYRKKESIDS